MSVDDTYKKYIKCKNDYNALKIKSLCFNFNHHTKDIKSLKNILKSGKIKPGFKLKKSQRKLSGGVPLKYIYCSIFFNKHNVMPYSLILSPKILLSNKIIFNKGWISEKNENSVIINEQDTIKSKIHAIKKIKKTIKTKKSKFDDFLSHEVLISNTINVQDYVIGISCFDKDKSTLQKYLKKYNYKNIEVHSIYRCSNRN